MFLGGGIYRVVWHATEPCSQQRHITRLKTHAAVWCAVNLQVFSWFPTWPKSKPSRGGADGDVWKRFNWMTLQWTPTKTFWAYLQNHQNHPLWCKYMCVYVYTMCIHTTAVYIYIYRYTFFCPPKGTVGGWRSAKLLQWRSPVFVCVPGRPMATSIYSI